MSASKVIFHFRSGRTYTVEGTGVECSAEEVAAQFANGMTADLRTTTVGPHIIFLREVERIEFA